MKHSLITILALGALTLWSGHSVAQSQSDPAADRAHNPIKLLILEIRKLNESIDDLAAAGERPTDCSGKADCGDSSVSCSVKGDGNCSSTDGVGATCTQILADGSTSVHEAKCQP